MKRGVKLFCLMALVVVFAFASIACGASTTDSATGADEKEDTVEETITFGSTFVFDDLEITFADEVEWTTLDNQFSDYDGADVIVLPIHVKNVGEENNHLNIFAVTVYGSSGAEVEEFSTYYEDSIFNASDLRPGAEHDTNIYIQYDGDGTYYVSFGLIDTEAEASFEITK